MLKKVLLAIALTIGALSASQQADADMWVRGYYRSNGTYVRPHYRSDPDGYFYNNWSTYPNINPYTGRMGTRRTPSYGSGYGRSYYSPSWSYWRW
jgi:hypothetical protein